MLKTIFPKTKGFTLIEMLLVITIIGILVTLSMSTFQRRTIDVKADRTALEIQTILQAASTYYTANNQWPAANATQPTDQISTDFIPFLPVSKVNDKNQILNAWGYPYYIAGNPDNVPPPQNDTKFLVQAQVPLTPQGNTLAKQIASLLPFGEANQNMVIAYVPIPGQQAAPPNQIIIKAIGYAENQMLVSKPTCPTNYYSNIFVTPSYFRSGKPTIGVLSYESVPASRIVAAALSFNDDNWVIQTEIDRGGRHTGGDFYDEVQSGSWGDYGDVKVTAMYIVACIPNPTKQPNF